MCHQHKYDNLYHCAHDHEPSGYKYIQNFEGPKIEPCGTPQAKSANYEVILSIGTH